MQLWRKGRGQAKIRCWEPWSRKRSCWLGDCIAYIMPAEILQSPIYIGVQLRSTAVSRSLCPGILRLLGSHRNMIAVDACHEPQGKKEHGILRSVGSRDEDSRSRELAASASLDSSRPGQQHIPSQYPMMNRPGTERHAPTHDEIRLRLYSTSRPAAGWMEGLGCTCLCRITWATRSLDYSSPGPK